MEEQVKNLAIVLDGKEVGIYSFPTLKQANSFKKAAEIPEGGMILVTRGVEGLKASASSFLVELHNLVTPEYPVKKFSDRKTALRRVYEALTSIAEEKTMENGNEKAPKEKKLSYHAKIRAHFKDHDTATVQEIMEITGADKRNAKVAMNIICNPKRVKNPMKFDYVKSTKTYYLLDDGFGRKGQTEVPVQEDSAEKEKCPESGEGETPANS